MGIGAGNREIVAIAALVSSALYVAVRLRPEPPGPECPTSRSSSSLELPLLVAMLVTVAAAVFAYLPSVRWAAVAMALVCSSSALLGPPLGELACGAQLGILAFLLSRGFVRAGLSPAAAVLLAAAVVVACCLACL